MDLKSPKGFAIVCAVMGAWGLTAAPQAASNGHWDFLGLSIMGGLVLFYSAWRLVMPRLRITADGIAFRGIWFGKWHPMLSWPEIEAVRFKRLGLGWPVLVFRTRQKETKIAAFPGVSAERRSQALSLIEHYAGPAFQRGAESN